MGQANLKRRQLEDFQKSLSEQEKIIFNLSQIIQEKFIKPTKLRGACYRISILMKVILEKKYGINSEAVVGYLNDGDDIFISHAWLNTQGKKTDLMAARPPVGENYGPIIILDYEFKGNANVNYTYHTEKTEQSLQKEREIISTAPSLKGGFELKEREHARV
jgi:hypothetical protein